LSTLSRELGVEGIPVCSECPLYGEECLVKQGIPCLGPLTVAGCDAECTRQSAPCIGCRGFTSSIDVWRNAIKYYRDNGISREHLESALSIFWVVIPVKLREIINEVYKQ
jgi:sulfhydrogenase subunit delta